MTTLSELFPQSAIASIQTGFVDSDFLSTGSGETTRYLDVTVSAVVAANCRIYFDGTANSNAFYNQSYFGATTASNFAVTATLTSTTNLRLACSNSGTVAANISGRWTIVEYA